MSDARDDKYCEAAQQFAAAWEAGKSLEYCAGILEERLAPSAEGDRLAQVERQRERYRRLYEHELESNTEALNAEGERVYGRMLDILGAVHFSLTGKPLDADPGECEDDTIRALAARMEEAVESTRSHGGDSEGLRHCECRFNAQGVIVDECGYHLGARLNAIETATRLRDILHSARIAPSSTRSKA